MDEKTNEKVINLFKGGATEKATSENAASGKSSTEKATSENAASRKSSTEKEAHKCKKDAAAVKFFAGVNYVRLDEDVNGYPFNKAKLLENAEKFSYIVRVLKPKDGKISLYNYNVPYEKIVEFISMFANNELSGTIVDIDKYKPNELA